MCLYWDNLIEKSHIGLFLFVELAFFFGCGILVLLIFRDQVVHVGFGFSEFHLIHTFSGVPVKEGLSPEHASELFSHSLEHFLNSSGVTNEGDSHLEALGGDITDGTLHVIGDPFNEVG